MNNHNTSSCVDASSQDLIVIKGLKKHFSTRHGLVPAVDGIDFTLAKGTIAAIIGPSGSGKSTLLNLLGTLESPSEGEIIVDGTRFDKLSENQATKYRRTKIGFIFQSYNLIPNLSALENVELPMEYAGIKTAKRRARALECLQLAELPVARYQHLPSQLSGGEQQRVAIARALANDPLLILADEPTGSLDSQTSNQILELLVKLAHQEGKIVVIVTHDHSIAAQADVLLMMRDGQLEDVKVM